MRGDALAAFALGHVVGGVSLGVSARCLGIRRFVAVNPIPGEGVKVLILTSGAARRSPCCRVQPRHDEAAGRC
jgi:hypothetical protein